MTSVSGCGDNLTSNHNPHIHSNDPYCIQIYIYTHTRAHNVPIYLGISGSTIIMAITTTMIVIIIMITKIIIIIIISIFLSCSFCLQLYVIAIE